MATITNTFRLRKLPPVKVECRRKRRRGKSDNERSSFTVRKTAEQVKINLVSPQAMVSDHEQRGCEICSKASVGGTEKNPSCGFT
ncbi:hypothetical protein TNCV_3856231 [Trichonephila clavipes]|nr:hypothetical protein TNCV_3856231 [Trichonephila clavipes]